MSKKDIYDLESLDREIDRLRARARVLEEKIDQSLDYLQDHYSSMAIKSVLPSFLQKSGIAGSVVQLFLQDERLRENLGKLGSYLLDKVSDGLEFVANKLSRGKEETL
jgi:hypothetical protein